MRKFRTGRIVPPTRCRHEEDGRLKLGDIAKQARLRELREILDDDGFDDRYTIFEARHIIDEYAALVNGAL